MPDVGKQNRHTPSCYDEEEQGPVLTEASRVADRMLPGGAW